MGEHERSPSCFERCFRFMRTFGTSSGGNSNWSSWWSLPSTCQCKKTIDSPRFWRFRGADRHLSPMLVSFLIWLIRLASARVGWSDGPFILWARFMQGWMLRVVGGWLPALSRHEGEACYENLIHLLSSSLSAKAAPDGRYSGAVLCSPPSVSYLPLFLCVRCDPPDKMPVMVFWYGSLWHAALVADSNTASPPLCVTL